jgi:hypothetical protein
MACSVLDKTSLVTETIAAVGAHAMEVCLVFPVTTMWVLAVLIKPISSTHKRIKLNIMDSQLDLKFTVIEYKT